MHMADALISPATGGTLWAVSAGLLGWCGRKLQQAKDDGLVPLMGVMGAFVFAAQMLNFSIPFTGSSGHLGGGLMLAVLLGPYAAFVVIASVLTVQALFFLDGGLLALGCNIVNLGFFPAFVAYPLIYRPLAGPSRKGYRAAAAATVAAVVGLQLGAFAVVMETTISGISDLPFRTFVMLMQPIHLAIGVVEGLATAAVVAFVAQARPEALGAPPLPAENWHRLRPLLAGLALATLLLGGVASWFASTHPDGLEWAVAKVTGKEEKDGPADGVHEFFAVVQSKTALLPGYGFRTADEAPAAGAGEAPAVTASAWPAVDPGTSLSGLLGGAIMFALALLTGWALKKRSGRVPAGLTRTAGS